MRVKEKHLIVHGVLSLLVYPLYYSMLAGQVRRIQTRSCIDCLHNRSPPHQGHPLSLAHLRISKLPLNPTNVVLSPPHGHSFCLAHFNTSKCPPAAAAAQVFSFQLNPFSLATTSRDFQPPEQVSESKEAPLALAPQIGCRTTNALTQRTPCLEVTRPSSRIGSGN